MLIVIEIIPEKPNLRKVPAPGPDFKLIAVTECNLKRLLHVGRRNLYFMCKRKVNKLKSEGRLHWFSNMAANSLTLLSLRGGSMLLLLRSRWSCYCFNQQNKIEATLCAF